MAHRARATQTELDLGIIQEVEMETDYKRKAASYFEEMSTEEKNDFFVKKKSFIFNVSQTSHITNTVHMRTAKGFRGNKKA